MARIKFGKKNLKTIEGGNVSIKGTLSRDHKNRVESLYWELAGRLDKRDLGLPKSFGTVKLNQKGKFAFNIQTLSDTRHEDIEIGKIVFFTNHEQPKRLGHVNLKIRDLQNNDNSRHPDDSLVYTPKPTLTLTPNIRPYRYSSKLFFPTIKLSSAIREGDSTIASVSWPSGRTQNRLYWRLNGATTTDSERISGSINLDRYGKGKISISAFDDCNIESREYWSLQLYSDSRYMRRLGRPASIKIEDNDTFEINPSDHWYEGVDKNGESFKTFNYDHDGDGVSGDFDELGVVLPQLVSSFETSWRDKVTVEEREEGYVRFYTDVRLKKANGIGWDFYSVPRSIGTPEQLKMLTPPANLVPEQLSIDRSKNTIVYIHGWKDSSFSPHSRQMYTNMRQAYPDANVIMVDWAELARQVDPGDHFGEGTWATGSLQQVAESVADFLITNCVNPRTTKLIGHSYGAITASLAAKYINDNTSSILGEAIFIDYANNNYGYENPYDVDARDGFGRFDEDSRNWTKPPKLTQGGSRNPNALALRTYSYHAMDLLEKYQFSPTAITGNGSANNIIMAGTAGRSYHILTNNQQAGTVGITDETLLPYEREIYQVPAHTGALSVFGELAKLNLLTPEAAGFPQDSLKNSIDRWGDNKGWRIGYGFSGAEHKLFDGIIYARDPYLGTHFDQAFQKPFGWGTNVYDGTIRGSDGDDFMFFGNPVQGGILSKYKKRNLDKDLILEIKGQDGDDVMSFVKASDWNNIGILEGGAGADQFWLAAKQTILNEAEIQGLPSTDKHPHHSEDEIITIRGIDDGNPLNSGGPYSITHQRQFTVIKDLNLSDGDKLFIPYAERNVKYTTVGDYLSNHPQSLRYKGKYDDDSLAIFYDKNSTSDRVAWHPLGGGENLDLLAIISNIKIHGERPAPFFDDDWRTRLLSKVDLLKENETLNFSPTHVLSVDNFASPNVGVFDETNQASESLYGSFVGFDGLS